MPKSGKILERIVELVERSLSECSNVKIEKRAKRRDRVTNRLREHDILITITQGHHEILLSLECRDLSRKVGVGAVEAFHTKCQHTGIDQRSFVSAKGFTAPALEKASFLGIRCLDLSKADGFSWLEAQGIKISDRQPIHLDLRVDASGLSEVPTEGISILVAGEEISREQLSQNIYSTLPGGVENPQPPGRYKLAVRINPENLSARDNSTGDIFPVVRAGAVAVYEVSYRFVPFELFSYGESGSSAAISEVATARMDTPLGPGRISVVFKPGEGGEILFSRESDLDDDA